MDNDGDSNWQLCVQIRNKRSDSRDYGANRRHNLQSLFICFIPNPSSETGCGSEGGTLSNVIGVHLLGRSDSSNHNLSALEFLL
jgi:hypothetical protein